MNNDPRPLIAHVVYRFDTGGLENGVVNLINHMPADRYRHAVIALTEVTDFRERIERDDVQFFSLRKPPGQTFWIFPQLFRLFRQLRPAIVHSRNLAALETQLPAWLAGVPVRIHGEHGRDVGDLDGSNVAYQRIRRFYRPFVTFYLALSRDLAQYLNGIIHIPENKMLQVYNGVDTERFKPSRDRTPILGYPFSADEHWVIGTVGRMQTVKDQVTLAKAFARAVELVPELQSRIRLAIVGDGPLKPECLQILDGAGIGHLAWLPGERTDIPEIMQALDCFVLPSLAEGISNTILEAMASGLPVIATDVGGNADLVDSGITGEIIPPADCETMARSIVRYASDPDASNAVGCAGRQRVEQKFSLNAMVAAYQGIYDQLMHRSGALSQH
ncbi:TIGR03088 family PEP-CTERM/XrtA system glycosyltransferase [Ferribacterium limneticum]|uniref:TIGR03088 family PEP-CTERM/XrtA system glycosyltransferase n=1 Tax=Ferribacterium limneticum TaxID=76259 RepID=UPI001CF8E35C|nr:TIGR03088 family PEP-CTERM/XrtA system glycosyltransferase [Ferribacterium limneticum]UCV26656.1 TIGR03088 family PEP-CTERM/XrtA system glycosyltransferase [Ferribacterium limneticum]UCV30573.1 TIGR03088 family PEP-CTERM/XrtA system glycosyltransferase [Ferribacterium limneticum]